MDEREEAGVGTDKVCEFGQTLCVEPPLFSEQYLFGSAGVT